MEKIRKIRIFLASLLCLTFIISCSGMGIRLDTPEKKYLGARAELNLLLQQYIDVQDKVSVSDQETAKKAFNSADLALDTWERMLGVENYDFSKDIKVWLETKRVVLNIIRSIK